MTKWTDDENIETILTQEIQKAINEEIIKRIKDPDYEPQLSPATFESLEAGLKAKAAWREKWNKVINRDIDD